MPRAGVDVRAFGDLDLRAQPGFERLSAGLTPVDGRIPVRFGDGPLSYNPELVDVIVRDGEHNRMSHNFIVCDERDLLTVTGGFGVTEVYQFGMHARSRDLGRDYADEFNQLFGGIDASTLSAFNGPLKSIADNREWYDSNVGRVEAYFGPQERLVKRMVDAVYGARASVYLVAEEMTSAPLADALRYKAEAGFEVVVIVADDGVDVESSRFARMQRELRGLPNARVLSAPAVAVNAVIIDADASPIDGLFHHGRALVTSEPLLAATSVLEGQVTTARASDAFTDANMFVFNRPVGEPSTAYDLVVRHFDAIRETAE